MNFLEGLTRAAVPARLGYVRGQRERESVDAASEAQRRAEAERMRAALAGESLRRYDIDQDHALGQERLAADTAYKNEVQKLREESAAALAEYRKGQLELGGRRVDVSARAVDRPRISPTAGPSAGEREAAQVRAKMEELLKANPGMPLEEAFRRARLGTGRTPGISSMEAARAKILGDTLPPPPPRNYDQQP